MLGPSGCGKTTTLKMIAGFEQPTPGQVLLERRRRQPRTPPYKRNVNTVFQQYALFPHMTVADNVALRAAQSKKIAEGRVRAAASPRCSRSSDSATSPTASRRQLSGGQQQRVALARALVNYAERAAARRAARCARPEAARGDAVRAQADPARGRHHVRVRHPRPGRGAHDERPHRRDERGPGRADRHARGDLPPPGDRCSSPDSSVRPTCCPARSTGTDGDDTIVELFAGSTVRTRADRHRIRSALTSRSCCDPNA